jgi:hypothetical protein
MERASHVLLNDEARRVAGLRGHHQVADFRRRAASSRSVAGSTSQRHREWHRERGTAYGCTGTDTDKTHFDASSHLRARMRRASEETPVTECPPVTE